MGRETTILAFLGKYIDENFKDDYVPPRAVGFFEAGFQAGENYATQSAWISVADRLPEIGQRVLAALDYGGSRIEYVHEDFGDVQTIWKDGKKYEYRYTHWFPLPQNPKASE